VSVLTRSSLEASPLADLHALASTIGIDGYRRLRKAELIDEIARRQGIEDETQETAGDEAPKRRARPAAKKPAASTTRRSRRTARDADDDEAQEAVEEEPEVEAEAEVEVEPEVERTPRSRSRSRARTKPVQDEPEEEPEETDSRSSEDQVIEGVVELLANGSGFVRVNGDEPSDGDAYLSAAQARRCELVSGDRVSGPVRQARRSERYPSLVRVETINGVAADEAVRPTRLEDREADFPSDLFTLPSDDPTLKAISKLAPFGRGSRVWIGGPSRSGKTEAVKRIAASLASLEGVSLELVVVGVRPEELTEWRTAEYATVTDLSFTATADAQAAAVEQAVERARRIAARGGDAVLIIDTLDGLSASAARRAFGSARNLRDGGSLTVIATSAAPLGGETTAIVFDRELVVKGRLPALDGAATSTIRADLLS
jgi:transcription termination factor Rho